MKSFSDLKIEVKRDAFVGNKIEVDMVLNQKITVHKFKIGKSKFEKGHGLCLNLQISVEGVSRVIFTSSIGLMDALKQGNEADFPFEATIVKRDRQYLFT